MCEASFSSILDGAAFGPRVDTPRADIWIHRRTGDANALLRLIHHRMPVVIDRLATNHWLDPGDISSSTLSILLQPFPSELMDAYEVSRLVNDPRDDSPACITAADWQSAGPLFET